MMIWGNMNYSYNQATMGYGTGSDFSGISYQTLGWSSPKLVGYMESHDEERLMYKNLTYGSTAGTYNVKNLPTALGRIREAAAFFITVPGPKMIWQFGELGYDYSINYPSLTSNDRLTAKPIRWDYRNDYNRKYLFNTFASLIQLKKTYPAFSNANFSINSSGVIKYINIYHSSMNVYIVGNFDVYPQTATGAFQSTGKWYEFFSADSLTVTDTHMQINLQPGEYRLYTTVRIPKPDFLTSVTTDNTIPKQYQLDQNYPNPFNPTTVINYHLPLYGHVLLKVYDVLGREVATLVNDFQHAGNYKVTFNNAKQLSSGIYFYRLNAGDFSQTMKMILMK